MCKIHTKETTKLMKDIKEKLKWRDIPRSQIGRLNIYCQDCGSS